MGNKLISRSGNEVLEFTINDKGELNVCSKIKNKLKNKWIEFVENNAPYQFHLNLKLKKSLEEPQIKSFMDNLVQYLNHYNTGNMKNTKSLRGFVYSDYKKEVKFYHLLIEPIETYKLDLEQRLFNDNAVPVGASYRVISPNGIHSNPISDETIVEYVTKTFKCNTDESCIGVLSGHEINWIKF